MQYNRTIPYREALRLVGGVLPFEAFYFAIEDPIF
jgi:hypothetical protein